MACAPVHMYFVWNDLEQWEMPRPWNASNLDWHAISSLGDSEYPAAGVQVTKGDDCWRYRKRRQQSFGTTRVRVLHLEHWYNFQSVVPGFESRHWCFHVCVCVEKVPPQIHYMPNIYRQEHCSALLLKITTRVRETTMVQMQCRLIRVAFDLTPPPTPTLNASPFFFQVYS